MTKYRVTVLSLEDGKQEIVEGDDALVQVMRDLSDGGQKWSFITHIRTSTISGLLAKVDIDSALDKLKVASLAKMLIKRILGRE